MNLFFYSLEVDIGITVILLASLALVAWEWMRKEEEMDAEVKWLRRGLVMLGMVTVILSLAMILSANAITSLSDRLSTIEAEQRMKEEPK